jgi:UDP-3-O-[3-hydroxymyristoyl] glucosamine N-acyltransferase
VPLTLGELAAFLQAQVPGDQGRVITGVAPLDKAGPGDLSFFANAKYAGQLAETKAEAVLISPADQAKAPAGVALLVSKNPYRDFARTVAAHFDQRPLPEAGIHPTAVVHSTAVVASSARVGALAVIEAGAQVGENSVIFPQAYIGVRAVIGKDCKVYAGAKLYDGTRIGDRVIIHAGAVLGSDGFGFAPDPPAGYVKVPQIGWVQVEDDVEIQANACIDRGALGATLIRQGAKIDNLVQVGHNAEVGPHTVLVSQTGISGSTKIGAWVTFAGQSAAGGHLVVGDQAVITGQSGIGKDVPAKAIVSGSPAQPMLEHHRGLAEMAKLPELKKRVKALEARLAELEKKLSA